MSDAWFLFLMTSRWFALRLDSICSLFITFATFGCILLRDGEELRVHTFHSSYLVQSYHCNRLFSFQHCRPLLIHSLSQSNAVKVVFPPQLLYLLQSLPTFSVQVVL